MSFITHGKISWKILLILTIVIVFTGVAILWYVGNKFLILQTPEIKNSVKDIKYCEIDSDCILVEAIEGLDYIPSLGEDEGCLCVTAINKKFESLWNQKKEEFRGKLNRVICKTCSYTIDNGLVACENKQCIVRFKENKTADQQTYSLWPDVNSFDLVNKTFEGKILSQNQRIKVLTTSSTKIYQTTSDKENIPSWEDKYYTFDEFYSLIKNWSGPEWFFIVNGTIDKEGVIIADEIFYYAQ